MSWTSSLNGTNSSSNSCWTKIVASKWMEAVLITGFVALLIIGIAASTGAFNAIGTTHAAYLSYGMYGGAALFLIAEISKLALNYCCKNSQSEGIDNRIPRSKNHTKSNTKSRAPVPLNYVSPAAKRSDPLSQEAIQNLKNEAEKYASSHAFEDPWSTKEQAIEHLRVYMLNIIRDREFQTDPTAYMEAWAKARGGNHLFAAVEDTARIFFIDRLKDYGNHSGDCSHTQ